MQKEGEMIDPVAGLEAVKFGSASLKIAFDIASELKDIDKKDQILRLRKALQQLDEDLLSSKRCYLQLAEDHFRLKHELATLKSKREMKPAKRVFWGKDGSGPYCPKCLQQEPFNEVIIFPDDPDEAESWWCRVCEKRFMSLEVTKRKHEKSLRCAQSYLRPSPF